jgi:tetratricopeptide (TPR) repeat protein
VEKAIRIIALVLVLSLVLPMGIFADTTATNEEAKLRNDFNQQKKAYDETVNKLNAAYNENPGWSISGEIALKQNAIYYIWGITDPMLGDPSSSHPGWLGSEGNIKILNPDSQKVEYGNYNGGPHYFIREEEGQNVFGGAVPVYVFGSAPKIIVTLQDQVNAAQKNLNDAKTKLVTYINTSFQSQLKSKPNDSDLYKAYGDTLSDIAVLVMDDTLINQAIDIYIKAIQLNPKNTAANIRLGIIYLSGTTPNNTAAIECFKKAGAEDPDVLISSVTTIPGYITAGDALMSLAKYDKAAVAFRKALAEEYKDFDLVERIVEADSYVAESYRDNNEFLKSAETLEKTMAILDNVDTGTKVQNVATPLQISVATAKIETLSYLGISYRLAGNTVKAVQAYEKALDLHSNIAMEYQTTYDGGFYQVVWGIKFELADLYCRQNKLKAAFDLLNNVVLLDKADSRWEAVERLGGDNANLNYVVGCVYSSNGKRDLAMKKIEKAIELDKTNPKYYNALGCIYFGVINADMSPEVKELYTVKDYLEKALKLDPNYSVACGNMSRILNEIKIYGDRMDDATLNAQIKAYAKKADAENSDGELEFTIYRKY